MSWGWKIICFKKLRLLFPLVGSKNTLQGSCSISRLVRNSTSAIQLLLATGLGQSQSLIAEVVDVVVVVAVAVAVAVVLVVKVSPL